MAQTQEKQLTRHCTAHKGYLEKTLTGCALARNCMLEGITRAIAAASAGGEPAAQKRLVRTQERYEDILPMRRYTRALTMMVHRPRIPQATSLLPRKHCNGSHHSSATNAALVSRSTTAGLCKCRQTGKICRRIVHGSNQSQLYSLPLKTVHIHSPGSTTTWRPGKCLKGRTRTRNSVSWMIKFRKRFERTAAGRLRFWTA